MSPIATALIFVCLIWWAATGAILLAVRLRERRAMAGRDLVAALPLLLGGVWAYVASLDQATPPGAYLGFLGALAIWAWVELSFLTGAITGPVKTPCPPALRPSERFWRAWGTVAHHEILLTLTLVLVIELAFEAQNSTGLWTFAILYVARISAKLNLFLGVAHVNSEFLPQSLAHLPSHFGKRRINWFFPCSISGLTIALWIFTARLWGADTDFAEVGHALLAALCALALLEHWFLVLPLPDAKLWRWMLPAPKPRPTGSEKRHDL